MSEAVLDWAATNLGASRRTGRENIFDCPFCGGKEKLWYNDHNNVYICYYCGMSGNGIALVAEFEEITYAAAKKLLGMGGDYVPPPMLLEEMFARFHEEQELAAQHVNVIQPCTPEGLLWHGNHPHDYVDYATESFQALLNRGFPSQQLLDMRAGYFVSGKYNMRTCLPVFIDGTFVYFQSWDHAKRYSKKYKYLNPKNEEVGMGRSQFFYNQDRWANAATLVVTEGIFNAWAVEQAGYPAVACFGKTISAIQFSKLLSHPCKKLILGHDQDAREVSVAICRQLRGMGKDCIIARVPEGWDWNDLDYRKAAWR